MNALLQQLEHTPLLMDGAMGTLLLARGAPLGSCLEALVVEQPARISAIHAAYLQAGADIITTHTFGANGMRLAEVGLESSVRDFNAAAVALAHAARAGAGESAWIAGNVGPVGRRVVWENDTVRAAVGAAFHEQITTLVDAGVDLLLFETFSDVAEIALAVEVARHITNLPIVASMSFDAQQHTLAGQSVEETTTRLVASGVEVIGANCSVGPAEMVETLRRMRAVMPDARISVAPNAGLPVQDDNGVISYPVGPEEFAAYAAHYVELGAVLVGGCCGTTPEYIGAALRVVDRPIS